MERTERLPVDRDQLAPRRPIPVRLVVRRADPEALRVRPHEVRLVVLDEVHHALLEQLVRRVLREREHVLWRVHLLLVQPAALDADGVHQQRDELHRHLHLRWLRGTLSRRRSSLRCGGAHAVQGTLGFLEFGLEV